MKINFKDIIYAMIFVFILSIFFILFNNNEKKDFSKIKEVSDSTQYYDVSSVVNKFVHNSNSKNKNILISLLDINYVNKNHINKNNIFKYVKKLDQNISFLGDIMYYEPVNDTIEKFYVSGLLQSVSTYDSENVDKFYVIVLMDKNKKTFSIIPDDGKSFMEVEKWMQN